MSKEVDSKDIDGIVAHLNKSIEPGSAIRLGMRPSGMTVPVISTGSIGIDYALGVGGLPRGRIIEIYGPESSGKTTVALQVIAQAQKLGGIAAFVDVEHALDAAYAQHIGVDISRLIFSQPNNAEQALSIIDALATPEGRRPSVDIIVLDSVAGLVPKAELEGEMGDAFVGVHARLMSQAMRKLTGKCSQTNTTVIFINQIREKIGVMFGSPETTSGGRALKFFSSVRLDVRRSTAIKEGDVQIGGRTKIKVVKNKLAPPMREAEIDVIYGKGFSACGEVVDFCKELGIIDVAGSWYAYKGERIGQGRSNAIALIESRPELFAELTKKVRDGLELP